MKPKINLLITIALFVIGINFSSCKKSDTSTTPAPTASEAATQADDQARVSNETDQVSDDANVAIDNYGGNYASRPSGIEIPTPPPLNIALLAGASVTADTANHRITITYSNDTTYDRKRVRNGSVVIQFYTGFRWSHAGDSITITYNNLRITRIRDGKNITINGTKVITNHTGGLLRNLAGVGTITHYITSSNMSVTFDDGTTRTWTISKQRTFTYSGGIVITETGLGGVIAESGITRSGRTFTAAITQPLVVEQSCNFHLVSGQITFTTPAISTVTTFGLDASGNPISTPGPTTPLFYGFSYTITGQTPVTFPAYIQYY